MFDFEPAREEGLRQRNKRDKRGRILEAARALFSEKGFDATTTREIAERAGVGTGTLFSYARDKRELMYLVFKDRLERTQARAFATLPEGGGLVDRLMHVFGRYFDAYEQDPTLARDFLRQRFHVLLDARGAGEAMTGMALDFFERLAALVEDAREREGLRAEVPATLAAMNFFAIYVLVVDSWLGSPWGLPRESFEPMLRDALALQIDGLREASASRRGEGRP